jgi:predicted dithiol-disulfide oxidoreductase (DUF899 family)
MRPDRSRQRDDGARDFDSPRRICEDGDHKIETREESLAAREQLLVREKEHTRLGDAIAEQRRELPWSPVEKEYRFDTNDGEKALIELFDGLSQLLVYHFMVGPATRPAARSVRRWPDGINGVVPPPARSRGRPRFACEL